MTRPITAILRQKEGGTVGFEKWSYLGQRLVECEDPEGLDIPSVWKDSMIVDSSLPKIPARVWNAVVELYVHFMEDPDTADLIKGQSVMDSGLEVAVFFTFNEETSEVQAWVPTQAISGASVEIDYTDPIVNLITGEVIEAGINGLPDCVIKTGTSHSHNTMWAGFSSTDDRNELPQHGYHIVAGAFQTKDNDEGKPYWYHEIASSIVMGGKRYRKVLVPDPENPGELVSQDMHYRDLIDYDTSVDGTFDKSVLNLISMDLSSFRLKSKGSKPGEFALSGFDADELDYYAGYGWQKHRGTYYGGFKQDTECADPLCNGDVSSYTGYCFKCGSYYPDEDCRHDDIIAEDKMAEPVYNGEGNIMGWRTRHNGSGKYVYRYAQDNTLFRLTQRYGWKLEGEEPWKNSSKSQRKRGQKGDRLSSHSAVSDQDIEGIVDHSMKWAEIVMAEESQDRIIRYELKEFAKICTFIKACTDPKHKLQRAMHRIFTDILDGTILTEIETERLTDMMMIAGFDWTDLDE